MVWFSYSNELLSSTPTGRSFLLARLEPFLEMGLDMMAQLINLDALAQAQEAKGNPYGHSVWQRLVNGGATYGLDKLHGAAWVDGMCRELGEASFREGALLFQLHCGALLDEVPVNERASLLLLLVEEVVGGMIFPFGKSQHASPLFSDADRCALLCSTLALMVTQGKPPSWKPSFKCGHAITFSNHFWPAFDQEHSALLLQPLCRQIASLAVSVGCDGQFTLREAGLIAPLPLTVPVMGQQTGMYADDLVLWRQRLRGVLVESLRRGWISVEEAKQAIALHPGLDPWYLLATSSADWAATGTAMDGFVRGLRERFAQRLVQLSNCTEGEPDMVLNLRQDVEQVVEWKGSYSTPLGMPLAGDGLVGAAQWAAQNPGMLSAKGGTWGVRMCWLAGVTGWDTGDGPDLLLDRLRAFPATVLAEVLPWAGAAQALVQRALNEATGEPAA